MAISLSVDKPKGLTVFAVEGELTLGELFNALRTFYGNDPNAKTLWDLSKMERALISSEELRETTEFIKKQGSSRPSGKTALVAKSDAEYGLSRVMEEYSQVKNLHWQIRAFRSMDEAILWLDEEPTA